MVAANGVAAAAAGDVPVELKPAARPLEARAARRVTLPEGEVVVGRLKVRDLDSDEQDDEDERVKERRHGGRRVQV